MRTYSSSRVEIELISTAYVSNRLMIIEHNNKIRLRNEYDLALSKKIVQKIENAIETLEERDKFIIVKEVIERQRGNWYLGYLSPSTYYRTREKAYKEFLNCLER